MKRIYCHFLVLMIVTSCNVQNRYWEELNKPQKAEILRSVRSDLVLTYYNGEMKLSDDSITVTLLDDLIQSPDSLMPLSFYLFNNICKSSDGAVTEIISNYCIDFIVEHPEFVFSYFQKYNDKELLDIYAMLIGYELYLKDKGLSNINYDYMHLKNHIKTKVADQNLETTIDTFWRSIDATIESMN